MNNKRLPLLLLLEFALLGYLSIIVHALEQATTTAIERSSPPPINCPPTGRFDFGYYEKVCGSRKFSKIDELAGSRRFKDGDISEFWETFELCACHLIGHDIFWKAMLTHEAECLYMSIERSIDDYDQAKANESVESSSNTGRHLEFFKEQQDLRLYYWDSLEIILNNLARPAKKNDYADFIADTLQTHYANICYNPLTLQLDFEGSANGLKVKQSITRVCDYLDIHAKPILSKLGDLQRGIKNDRLIFRLATSNEELYKIRMVLVLCHNLEMNGMLL